METGMQERIDEYKALEKFYSRKLQRTKEEGKHQIESLKSRVTQIKQGEKTDQDYLKIIEDLEQKLKAKETTQTAVSALTPMSGLSKSTNSWND
jgi:uncharacterized protein YdeI (YjbR/CyaY-like superfamily)